MDQLSVSETAPEVKWSSSALSKLPDPSVKCAAIVKVLYFVVMKYTCANCCTIKTLFTEQTIKLNQMIRVVGILDLNRPETTDESKMDVQECALKVMYDWDTHLGIHRDPLHQDAFQNVPIIHALSIKELSVEELSGSTEKLSADQMGISLSLSKIESELLINKL